MCVFVSVIVIIFQLHVYFHHPRVNRWTRNALCRLIQIADVRSFHPNVLYDVLGGAAVVFLVVCDKNTKHTQRQTMPACDEKRVLLCFCSLCDALNDDGATYCCPQPRNTFTTVFKIIRKLVYFLLSSVLTLLVWRQEGHLDCKKLGAGLLMVTTWLQFCSSYSSGCHHHLHHP